MLTRLFLAFTLLTMVFSGEALGQKKTVVCSTTQIADFARQIVGDDWEVLCVLGAGQDPHSYQPRSPDSDMVVKADLCLQNGWHLEGNEWMQKLADQNGKRLVTCVTGIKPLQTGGGGESKTVRDPHAWFTPANAVVYVKNILTAVSEVDPENATKFRQRAELYVGQLNALDIWIKLQVVQIPAEKRLLVTHHDAFGYFCKAYHFKGLSPADWKTEEMSGMTIDQRQKVVEGIREIGVRSIFVETSLNENVVTQIAGEAGVEIGGKLYSDAMGPAGSAGETYIGMMRENVLTIVAGLK